MTDPYFILSVSPVNADDETVRAAYLSAIRACPPETNRHRFEQVRAAYEAISTVRGRLNHALFDPTAPTTEDILNTIAVESSVRRPDERLLKRVLGLNI